MLDKACEDQHRTRRKARENLQIFLRAQLQKNLNTLSIDRAGNIHKEQGNI